jgi:hypothetical protein
MLNENNNEQQARIRYIQDRVLEACTLHNQIVGGRNSKEVIMHAEACIAVLPLRDEVKAARPFAKDDLAKT